MITIENLTKKQGDKTILDNISFSVKKGEFVALLGPSGVGKTTLINIIIGADEWESGKVIVNHYNVGGLQGGNIQKLRRKIGIIFQDYKLLPRKTVYENIAFALEVSGYEKNKIQKETIEILKLINLEDLRNNYPHELSGGERQRVAIGRAIIHAPELLIADEPTGNLDSDNIETLCDLFLKINKEKGTTIFLSTHNPAIIKRVKPRIITLSAGKISENT
ncbi:cell division ATP-binding protein FtsE [Candidatus Peregrinibacteria bacterium HGW-Peregrinibacteria-1]|jgi:cell division transport system ATP-binding protein|nr:MAG: cell division ATP-binding protein FtsE [Candidatus Peregrinibacteria bacterium HGW-Peregrinibacteria-1]